MRHLCDVIPCLVFVFQQERPQPQEGVVHSQELAFCVLFVNSSISFTPGLDQTSGFANPFVIVEATLSYFAARNPSVEPWHSFCTSGLNHHTLEIVMAVTL